ncbi:MAG: hypothetical protein ACRDH2_15105, partial [Anaerolineales bacterium]
MPSKTKKVSGAAKKTARKRSVARRKSAVRQAPVPAAPLERFGLIEVGGKPATVVGEDVVVGQKAPHFKAQVGLWSGQDL